MNPSPSNNPEKKPIDDLIAWALRQPDDANPESALTDEDREALDSLGPNLVNRILLGAWGPSSTRSSSAARPHEVPEPELAGALNRGGEDGELTDAAKKEMERKRRELDDKDAEEDSQATP